MLLVFQFQVRLIVVSSSVLPDGAAWPGRGNPPASEDVPPAYAPPYDGPSGTKDGPTPQAAEMLACARSFAAQRVQELAGRVGAAHAHVVHI